MNPAAWEISGHMVLKRKKDFEEASEAYVLRLLSEVSLSEERFQKVKAYIFDAIGLEESEEELDVNENKETFQASSLASHFCKRCLILQ